MIDTDAPSVAAVLGLDPIVSGALAPYEIGSEPIEAQKPRPRSGGTRRERLPDIDSLLEPFVEDAKAGVPDKWLGRRVGLTQNQVARWRRRRQIERRLGRPSLQTEQRRMAVDIYGESPEPVVIPTSPVDGQWTPPEYLLKRPVDYSAFAELVHLALEGGRSREWTARAVGVRTIDVEHAARLWQERRST